MSQGPPRARTHRTGRQCERHYSAGGWGCSSVARLSIPRRSRQRLSASQSHAYRRSRRACCASLACIESGIHADRLQVHAERAWSGQETRDGRTGKGRQERDRRERAADRKHARYHLDLPLMSGLQVQLPVTRTCENHALYHNMYGADGHPDPLTQGHHCHLRVLVLAYLRGLKGQLKLLLLVY